MRPRYERVNRLGRRKAPTLPCVRPRRVRASGRRRRMNTREQQPAAETTNEVLAKAEAWFRGQVEISRRALGASWPEHKAWVIDYLRQEARQRLIARGWRLRDGR